MALDPGQNLYDLLIAAVDKLGYVVQTLVNAATTSSYNNSTNYNTEADTSLINERICIYEVIDQAFQLALIDMRIQNESQMINSSR